ncbi:MAG: hypothetical protein R2867_44505 [Caldilineaceae bacterium]
MLANWPTILLVVVLVALGKGLIFSGLSLLFRYRNVVPIAVGWVFFRSVNFPLCWRGWA